MENGKTQNYVVKTINVVRLQRIVIYSPIEVEENNDLF